MSGASDLDYILIKGASENNLQQVSLRIPKNKIVVFAGLSGSGKSSIVFDTVAIESKRQLNETFPWFIRNRLPKYEPPLAEAIENLSMALIVDQKPISGNSRSTVGTISDIHPLIRLLFSRCGVPSAGASANYSFNNPEGMCQHCGGLGRQVMIDVDKLLDKTKSINGGAIRFPPFTGSWQMQLVTNSGLFDLDKPLNQFSDTEMDLLLHNHNTSVQIAKDKNGPMVKFEGLLERFKRIYIYRDINTLSKNTKAAVLKIIKEGECPFCHGDRLNEAALKTQVCGYNIAEMCNLEIPDLIQVLQQVEHPMGTPIAQRAIVSLQRIIDIGLGYLSLSRTTESLSGGESQRLKMVKYLSGSLIGLTYIFDEPSIGLHPSDVERLNNLLIGLRDKGNTVLVVEHDKNVISIADEVIEMGPGAGIQGGTVVFQGSYAQLLRADTLTGTYLRHTVPLNSQPRTANQFLPVHNAELHNLKHLNLEIPVGILTAISGVAGSGKSSLCEVFMTQHPKAVKVDQSAIGTNSRSTPASYIGIMDEIRNLFATANQVSAGLFSFNSSGACPVCKGKGEIVPDMAFMDPVATTCEACGGKRYNEQALSYRLHGKNILEVLELTVNQAVEFFAQEKFVHKLQALQQVGMGYLSLGQPTSSLSGGECQRVKLASELHKTGSIYIMDEPTTGLHMADIAKLMQLLNGLVDRGNTVIVIEHNLDIIKQADWVIDLGPGGGKHGGEILFSGTPQQLLQCQRSLTAQYLRQEC